MNPRFFGAAGSSGEMLRKDDWFLLHGGVAS
jgi:hypothetical protein